MEESKMSDHAPAAATASATEEVVSTRPTVTARQMQDVSVAVAAANTVAETLEVLHERTDDAGVSESTDSKKARVLAKHAKRVKARNGAGTSSADAPSESRNLAADAQNAVGGAGSAKLPLRNRYLRLLPESVDKEDPNVSAALRLHASLGSMALQRQRGESRALVEIVRKVTEIEKFIGKIQADAHTTTANAALSIYTSAFNNTALLQQDIKSREYKRLERSKSAGAAERVRMTKQLLGVNDDLAKTAHVLCRKKIAEWCFQALQQMRGSCGPLDKQWVDDLVDPRVRVWTRFVFVLDEKTALLANETDQDFAFAEMLIVQYRGHVYFHMTRELQSAQKGYYTNRTMLLDAARNVMQLALTPDNWLCDANGGFECGPPPQPEKPENGTMFLFYESNMPPLARVVWWPLDVYPATFVFANVTDAASLVRATGSPADMYHLLNRTVELWCRATETWPTDVRRHYPVVHNRQYPRATAYTMLIPGYMQLPEEAKFSADKIAAAEAMPEEEFEQIEGRMRLVTSKVLDFTDSAPRAPSVESGRAETGASAAPAGKGAGSGSTAGSAATSESKELLPGDVHDGNDPVDPDTMAASNGASTGQECRVDGDTHAVDPVDVCLTETALADGEVVLSRPTLAGGL